jgi:hypothetical protein
MLAFAGGCLYLQVGDNAVRVRGEIVSTQSSSDCQVEIHLAEVIDKVLATRKVAGSFAVGFTLSPQKRAYRLLVRCSPIGVVGESEPFVVEDIRYFRKPIDLGRFVLQEVDSTERRTLIPVRAPS